MNSLFRSVIERSKDSLLKESLQSQLISCVKDIQLDHAHSGRFQSSAEAAEELCTILEAIFIHGIKETFADKLVIAIGDPDTRPEPNFWPALLLFSHREFIDQIGKLNFISTDIGRCRAWLRMALNDSLLTSYLHSMLAQNSVLKSYYKRSAYLRDTELLDMFITLISSIEMHTFSLACNSSLLNMWTNQPLLMAGIWSPAMKSCPITSATDIARSLAIEDSVSRQAEDSLSSVVSVASYYESSLGSSAFDEDEALKIILGTDVAESQDQRESAEDYSEFSNDLKLDNKAESSAETAHINEAGRAEEHTIEEVTNNIQSKVHSEDKNAKTGKTSVMTENEVEHKKQKLQSYHSLFESYNETPSKIPDLQDLLQKFPMPRKPSTSAVVPFSSDSDYDMMAKLDYEVVPDDLDLLEIPDFRMLLQHIFRIPTEQGLDTQNYICRTCTQHVGLNFGPAKVCGLTGAYYCAECFGTDPTNEYCVIPARAIFNWDFRRYSVSHRAAEFLSQIHLYPLFDISTINPKVYSAVEEMIRVKELRVRLNFLRLYLATCKENVMESLQKQIWPRDYLYEKIHHYSIADLIQVSTGVLESVIQKSVEFARSHVVSCTFCSQKGFICEKCDDPQVIFPFDLDTTYRCKNCSSVYHAQCLQAGQLCPKCLRIQQRELAIQLT